MSTLRSWTLACVVVLACFGQRDRLASAAVYDEDGDPELYRWRTKLQGLSLEEHQRRRNWTHADDELPVTVHLVPHAHLDVGWLKTVEECWYGANSSIQDAAVNDIISSVVGSLTLNPSRKWTIGEQAFFQRWYRAQGPDVRNLTRRLVRSGQLVFVDGGWSQHDTGCTHYTTMVDQTTFGQKWLLDQFGIVPRIGWHLDPFGHTATQGSLLCAEVGFDAFFFGRIDYQDRDKRRKEGNMEMLWRPSPSLGNEIFSGALPVGTYCPPPNFNFGSYNDPSPPVMDDPFLGEINVHEYVEKFVEEMTEYSSYVRGRNVMVLMGCDYAYQNSATWYENLDRLIDAVNLDGRVRALYSDPETYIDAKHAENVSFPVKQGDDFIPISQDFPALPLRGHMYWTGYFTSRPSLKQLVRGASSFLRDARLLRAIAPGNPSQDPQWPDPTGLSALAAAVGIGAHHDAVTGTERQPVAYDYAKRISRGLDAAEAHAASALRRLSGAVPAGSNLTFCRLLNESICEQSARVLGGKQKQALRVVVFNQLVQSRTAIVRLPTGPTASLHDRVAVLNPATSQPLNVSASVVAATPTASQEQHDAMPNPGLSSQNLVQIVLDMLPLQTVTLDVSLVGQQIPVAAGARVKQWPSKLTTEDVILEDDHVAATFDRTSGHLKQLKNKVDGHLVAVNQAFYYYSASNSGPWMLRPDGRDIACAGSCTAELSVSTDTSGRVVEVHQKFGTWIAQTSRLIPQQGQSVLEMEWTVGPVPIGDGVSKEVFTRYTSDVDSGDRWSVDSNGYEYLTRRRNWRKYYTLNLTEPVASNVYNMNAATILSDGTRDFVVLNDRSQGCTSLSSGELDVFLHRRLLGCDYPGGGGVEPLNETRYFEADPTGGVTPLRHGPGIVVRGIHRLGVTGAGSGARVYRPGHDDVLRPVRVAISAQIGDGERHANMHDRNFCSGYNLPANVGLLSLEREGDDERSPMLLRLQHLYAVNEDSILSSSATVPLGRLFDCLGVRPSRVTELTLTANQNLEHARSRLSWKADGSADSVADSFRNDEARHPGSNMNITLTPLKIRTFRLSF